MRWVRDRGWRLEECAEGEPVRLRFDSEEEAVQFALSFGACVGLLDPAGLREKILAAAQEVVGLYER
jgi:hypothetical protein